MCTVRGEETVPQRPRSRVRKDAQEIGREWECNLGFMKQIEALLDRVGVEYSSAIWRPERFWNKKRWGAKGNPWISKTTKFHVGWEMHLAFLISSLPAWVHWLITRGDFRGGGDRGFETFPRTQKHLGKGERKGNMQDWKKKKKTTTTKLECRIISPFFKGGFFSFNLKWETPK